MEQQVRSRVTGPAPVPAATPSTTRAQRGALNPDATHQDPAPPPLPLLSETKVGAREAKAAREVAREAKAAREVAKVAMEEEATVEARVGMEAKATVAARVTKRSAR